MALRDSHQQCSQSASLALSHRANRLNLGHWDLCEELAASRETPPSLTHEEIGDGHAVRLPGRREDYFSGTPIPPGHAALELGAGKPHLVGALQR
jgi:hypothetical protein